MSRRNLREYSMFNYLRSILILEETNLLEFQEDRLPDLINGFKKYLITVY